MSPTVAVRYVDDGYILTSQNQPEDIATTMYVASIAEVVFWIDKIFNPTPPATARAKEKS